MTFFVFVLFFISFVLTMQRYNFFSHVQNIFAIIFPLFFQLADTHREKISEIPQKKPPTPYGMSGKQNT